jgi:hypothetical protein
VDYAHLELSSSANKTISSTFNAVQGAPVTVTSATSTPLTFTLKQTTYSVPLEITTSLRLLSLITVYGGIGLDWQLGGGSDMQIAMTANLKGSYQGITYDDLGSASINAKGSVKPDAARMREIFGVQLGLFDVVRLFAQVNTTASSPMLTSLALGLRLAI